MFDCILGLKPLARQDHHGTNNHLYQVTIIFIVRVRGLAYPERLISSLGAGAWGVGGVGMFVVVVVVSVSVSVSVVVVVVSVVAPLGWVAPGGARPTRDPPWVPWAPWAPWVKIR